LRCWIETATIKALAFLAKEVQAHPQDHSLPKNAQNRPESGTKQLYPLFILKKSKPPAKPEVLIFLI